MDTEVEDNDLDLNLDQGEEQQESQTQQSGTTTPPPAKSESAEMVEAMKTLAESMKRPTAPATAAAPTRQPTQDEIDQYWGVWNPTKEDPDFFRKFLRLNTDMEPAEVEAAVKQFAPLFGMMQKGLVRQAVVGSKRLYEQEIARLREELKPLQDHYSESRSEGIRNRFFSDYPVLKDAKFSPIVDASARLLADKDFANEAEYRKALAETAGKAIKGLIPDFDLATKPTPGKTPKLPRTSVGGSGGAGSGAGTTSKTGASKNDADSLFD